MLTVTAAFERERIKGASAPTMLIDVQGLTGGKFVWAPRNVLGYPRSVKEINGLASELDPVSGEQTLSSLSIEFIDDGYIAKLINANYLVGKDVKIYIGFDTGSDSTFQESDYLQIGRGIISNHTTQAGKLALEVMDYKTALWKKGAEWRQQLPVSIVTQDNADQQHAYRAEGPASLALYGFLKNAGIPDTYINVPSFQPANCPATGHLVIDKRRLPDVDNYQHSSDGTVGAGTTENGPPVSDRRLWDSTSIQDLITKVTQILRAHLMVDETGKMNYVEYNASTGIVDTLTMKDIVTESFKSWMDFDHVYTSIAVRSAWEGLVSAGGPKYRFAFTDSDNTSLVNFDYGDGTNRKADWNVDDEWFSTMILRDWNAANIGAGDVSIGSILKENDNFTGQGINSPHIVDSTHPMYLAILAAPAQTGWVTPQTIEIVKCTSVVTNGDGSFTFNNITRGQFGTTARQHGNAGLTPPGSNLTTTISEVIMCDVTAIMRAVDIVMGMFGADGSGLVEFETPLTKIKIQVNDMIGLVSDLYKVKGFNGLVVGNSEKFRCLKKDIDWMGRKISWRFHHVKTPTPVHVIHGGLIDNLHLAGALPSTNLRHPPGGLGAMFSGPEGQQAGSFTNAFIGGSGSAILSPASLNFIVPAQRIASPFGIIQHGEQKFLAAANKDTYVDFAPRKYGLSRWVIQAVNNGAGAPSVASGNMRAFKYVSNGTQVTSVTDLRNVASVDGGKHIIDASIITAKIGDNQITNPKILDGSITTTKILDGTITGPKIYPSSDFVFPSGIGVKGTGGFHNGPPAQSATVFKPYALVHDRPTKNWLKNPSFEVDLSNWQAQGGSTLTRVNTSVWIGTWAAQVLTVAATKSGIQSQEVASGISSANATNDTWWFSFAIKANSGVQLFRVEMNEYNSSHTLLRTQTTADFNLTTLGPANDAFSRFAYQFLATGTTTAFVRFSVINAASLPAQTFTVDGMMAERDGDYGNFYATSYTDGSMGPGYGWVGSADASESTRSGGLHNIAALDPFGRPFVIEYDGSVRAHRINLVNESGGDNSADQMFGYLQSDGNAGMEIGALGEYPTGDIFIKPKSSVSAGRFKVGVGSIFSAHISADYTKTAAHTIQFNSVASPGYNHGGRYSTSTFLFTAPEPGIYMFGFNMRQAGNGTEQYETYLYVNGSQVLNLTRVANNAGAANHNGCTTYELNTNDTVGIRHVPSAATNLTYLGVSGITTYGRFWGVRIA